MDEVYVIVSTSSLFEKERSEIPDDKLEFLSQGDVVKNSYRELLEEAYNNSTHDKETVTYNALCEMFSDQKEFEHDVSLFNRNAGTLDNKNLDEIIIETAGSSIYTTNQRVGGRERSLKTLEMYINTYEKGGNDDS